MVFDVVLCGLLCTFRWFYGTVGLKMERYLIVFAVPKPSSRVVYGIVEESRYFLCPKNLS